MGSVRVFLNNGLAPVWAFSLKYGFTSTMVMPFSVLFSVFGMGIALMGLQIRLSGQVRDQIRGVHRDIKDLNGRIERVEERLSGEIKAVRTELDGRIDQVRDELSGRIDQVSGDIDEAVTVWVASFQNCTPAG